MLYYFCEVFFSIELGIIGPLGILLFINNKNFTCYIFKILKLF